MNISDLKLAVKCCTSPSSEWEDTCGNCPLKKWRHPAFRSHRRSDKRTIDFEEMVNASNCIDALILGLAAYLPEEESNA